MHYESIGNGGELPVDFNGVYFACIYNVTPIGRPSNVLTQRYWNVSNCVNNFLLLSRIPVLTVFS